MKLLFASLVLVLMPASVVGQRVGDGADARIAGFGASGVVNNGRVIWSGGVAMKSKGVGGPYALRVRVTNEDLGFAETLTLRGIVESAVSFGGPFVVDGVDHKCSPLKKRFTDGDIVPLSVAVEVLEFGSAPFSAGLPDLGRGISGSKFVGGFATDAANDNPFDRGTTTLLLKRPRSLRDRFSVMFIDDPASGRRQASLVFAGAWPKSVSLHGDWRHQKVFVSQQLGSIEMACG